MDKIIYWAIGFMEGEACFVCVKNGRTMQLVIRITQVQKEPCRREVARAKYKSRN